MSRDVALLSRFRNATSTPAIRSNAARAATGSMVGTGTPFASAQTSAHSSSQSASSGGNVRAFVARAEAQRPDMRRNHVVFWKMGSTDFRLIGRT
jgi:hypothetical protein